MGNSDHKFVKPTESCIKPVKLNTHIKGTIGEYQEIVNLTKAGWYVSKSCDPQCPFDLVAVSQDGKTVRLIDVKTRTYRFKKNSDGTRQKIGRCTTPLQKEMGVELILVDHGNL
tara:strand:- start:251 stop:592 length:342 start_codon:yes stop_codon:yes gene_type:complete